ncbi:MAG: cyclopropane-fatty-acyl-phospholipid synthase [Planctomycetota bacterium]|nr:cyclopropane-fatty-acyl-phospholipid synthase [Planctomycetota bacterium]
MSALTLLDRGLLPDWLVRLGIRRLLRRRLREEAHDSPQAREAHMERYVQSLRASPIAVNTRDANEQHYEVPAAFFEQVLGKQMKYSSGLWVEGVDNLDEAEDTMLALTVERAGIEDGFDILELGCGWGSLTLYMAARFPDSRIMAVSNSSGQRRHIESVCAARGLTNVEVVTRDINDFETTRRFDRVVSVEMLEHVRNYEAVMRQIRRWLKPEGAFFTHIFVHKTHAYPFETEGDANWLGRHFFTGGQMPSADLLLRFQDDLEIVREWEVNGQHYARTARAWLRNLDAHRAELTAMLARDQGDVAADVMIRRWRVFFMACEELWGYAGGTEWYVHHYLFRPRVATAAPGAMWPPTAEDSSAR